MSQSEVATARAEARYRKILDGAMTVILRHGFDRCSMQDIATESGITRAALYRYFSSKDDILHALVTSINEEANADATRQSGSDRPFPKRLLGVLEARLGRVHELLRAGPHGADISAATHRVTGHVVVAADREYLEIVEEMFRRAQRAGEIDLSALRFSPRQMAELCVFSAKGLMRDAGDLELRADYSGALKRLVRMVCATLL